LVLFLLCGPSGTHATSLLGGAGFDWTASFTLHLFHSVVGPQLNDAAKLETIISGVNDKINGEEERSGERHYYSNFAAACVKALRGDRRCLEFLADVLAYCGYANDPDCNARNLNNGITTSAPYGADFDQDNQGQMKAIMGQLAEYKKGAKSAFSQTP
jgi:hypothetical protein